MLRSATIQLPDQPEVVPSGKNVHDDSSCDQGRAEPQRKPVRLRRGMLNHLQLLEEEAEASHHKAEAHQGQPRPNPCQQSSLSR